MLLAARSHEGPPSLRSECTVRRYGFNHRSLIIKQQDSDVVKIESGKEIKSEKVILLVGCRNLFVALLWRRRVEGQRISLRAKRASTRLLSHLPLALMIHHCQMC